MARGGKRAGAGRKAGTRTSRKLEAERLARKILDDPAYQAALLQRAIDGTLAPAVEVMLWYQAVGKPPERLEHTGAEGGPLVVEQVQYGESPDPL